MRDAWANRSWYLIFPCTASKRLLMPRTLMFPHRRGLSIYLLMHGLVENLAPNENKKEMRYFSRNSMYPTLLGHFSVSLFRHRCIGGRSDEFRGAMSPAVALLCRQARMG